MLVAGSDFNAGDLLDVHLELEPAVQEQGLAPAEAHALKPAGSWVQGRAQSLHA